jgi:anti-sigma factor RsiW
MKQNCEYAQKRLPDLADGKLENRERMRVLGHLDECAACRGILAAEKMISGELHSLPRLRCPEAVTRAVLEHASAENRPAGLLEKAARAASLLFSRRALKPVLACALTLFFALVVSHQVRRNEPAGRTYTDAEIDRAGEIMKWSLVYSARQVQTSERRLFSEVLNQSAPETIERSVLSVYTKSMGN